MHEKTHSCLGGTVICLIFLLVLVPVTLGSSARGLKYIKNYSSGLHPQNWSIIQDNRGIVYAANNGCILEFDGVSQRIINIPNWWVRSLDIDDKGTIYVGGVNELGFLSLEKNGTRQYISLVHTLKTNEKNFSTVWQINAIKNHIYFRTSRYLFCWDRNTGKTKTWEPKDSFDGSFAVDGKLFIHQRSVGLMEMTGDTMQIVQGQETYQGMKIYMMVSYAPHRGQYLIGTRSHGFYIYDGKTSFPFPTEADDYLKKAQLYHGIALQWPGSIRGFALATLNGGVVIIDDEGKLVIIFDKASGLQDDNVKRVFQDTRGNLWLALSKGVSMIEYTSPLSFFNDSQSNLPGIVLSLVRHPSSNRLYAGTSRGLHVLDQSEAGSAGRFLPVQPVTAMCWSLLPVEDYLLAATDDGVFLIGTRTSESKKLADGPSYSLFLMNRPGFQVLVGTRDGLVSIRRENQVWSHPYPFSHITGTVKTIMEDDEQNLWLGTLSSGLIKAHFSSTGDMLNPIVTRYDQSHGLPEGEIRVFKAANHIIFAAGKKIYRFNQEQNHFSPDLMLGDQFIDGSKNVFVLAQDRNKHIYFHSEFINYHAIPQPGGMYIVDKQPFLRLPEDQVNVIYIDAGEGGVWFGGNEGLKHFCPPESVPGSLLSATLIREFVINGMPSLYNKKDGLYIPYIPFQKKISKQFVYVQIPYQHRNIRFNFALPFFEAYDYNRYRCFLEGFDPGWSEWEVDTFKDYTNLDSGDYVFHVQGKNVFDQESQPATFRFSIFPPWYKTWWAFTGYGLIVFFVLFLIVKWRSGKLEREKERLEIIVEARTCEIGQQKQQLEKQTCQLVEQADQLKELDQVKSRFFANISHEFRTPLTLIIGPIEQMLEETGDPEQKKQLQVILRNSRRLLLLINQLLDLSKFDSGKMPLQARWLDIVSFLKGLIEPFELLAKKNQLSLSFSTRVDSLYLYVDPGKIEVALTNLLINAVKYTPAGGCITVMISQPGRVVDGISGTVEIVVRDTGKGIPGEQLPHIFDRFFQVDTGSEPVKGYQGTGIGLSLTREIILLHHGTIEVDSCVEKESGTGFTIRLPLGKSHLLPGEIVSSIGDSMDSHSAEEILDLYTPGEEDDSSDSEELKEIPPRELILVVEDNADARRFIREILHHAYRVEEASDGNDGLEKARAEIPDLIVSDIMMPGLDGYQLCKALKTDIKTSHIPVILLTAKAADENIIKGLETGADDYITKPFNAKILLARIHNLIDLRQQWQQKIQREMLLQPSQVMVSSMDDTFLKEIQVVIEGNLSDSLFSVEQLGKKLYMSRATLYRKILALTGQSPREFIKSYRLKRAAQLLKAHFGNIMEVSMEVGFSSTSYFTKCFKEKFQQLPSSFAEPYEPGDPD